MPPVGPTFAVSGPVKRPGIFDPAFVRGMVEAHATKKADLRKPLWTLLVFELWRRHHIEQRTIEPRLAGAGA